MTEPLPPLAGGGAAEPPAPRSAGALLKAAREREGLHLAVLAATIKVSPAKLDALEKDRYDQLPNPTFARALAQSVCRSLKIDPRPVLALLPQQEVAPLESAVGRLNTPFDERPSRADGAGLAWASKPMFWAGGLLLLAAVLVGLMPREWVEQWQRTGITGGAATVAPTALLPAASEPSPGRAASAASAAASGGAAIARAADAPPMPSPAASVAAPSAPPALPASAPQPAVAASAAAVAATAAPGGVAAPAPVAAASVPAARAAGPGALQLEVSASSWIEVLDAQGNSLLSRVLQPGEALGLDGRVPLRLRVGNASGTRVSWRGQPVDLAPTTRDNVARIELR